MPRKKKSLSPHISVYYRNPEGIAQKAGDPKNAGLHREKSRWNQLRQDTKTLMWGENDSLPLRILDAVNRSPTATSCIGKLEKFIRGSGFADKAVEDIVIDDNGTTLLQLHSKICVYMALLDGYATNFKFNGDGKPQITNAFIAPINSLRFKKEQEETEDINCLVYNPYFGSNEYVQYQNVEYPFFDITKVGEQQGAYGDAYKGQIYFYGSVRPPYKFYPVPKYWSGEHWIYVDGAIQGFHKHNLDNGFFQSVFMSLIGDPDQMSQDHSQMREVTGTDGTVRREPTKTIGQMFDERMAATFSGVGKAGTVMSGWAANDSERPKIEPFPTSTNFDVMSGTLTDAIRGITIATEVPAILANLPQQQNSLGSDGNAMRAAVEIMNANVKDAQSQLEDFYNTILLPNHVNGSAKAKVKILPYSPITIQVPVDKQFWDWMNDTEKIQYIKDNVPTIKIDETRLTAPTAPVPGQAVPPGQQQTAQDEVLKNMKVGEVKRILNFVGKWKDGQLTQEQATQLLKGYGLTDEQIQAWLS